MTFRPNETEWVAETLKQFSYVNWDRYTTGEYLQKDRQRFAWMQIFGWIDREDSYKDFVVIAFEITGVSRLVRHIMTSSARFSEEINLAIGEKEHNICERVEDLCDIPNTVKLSRAREKKED